MACSITVSEMPPLAERRKARKRTLLSGTVTHSQGRFSFPCTIRDVSASGARIAFARGSVLPGEIYLIDRRNNVGHRCAVAWVRDAEAGLAFRASFPMHALPADADFLRRFAPAH
ncbi:MAG TPA: PilZ domain-containing protein [Rhizomicrobium sp.]